MVDTTKVGFEKVLDELLSAAPRNKNKADPVKKWIFESFGISASVSWVADDKQHSNRINEQFAHHDSTVVFVMEPGVPRKGMSEKINARRYPALRTVLLIGTAGKSNYTYEKLFVKSDNVFADWAKEELGVSKELFDGIGLAGDILDEPLQKVVYGAPGTGKSFGMDDIICSNDVECFRTTFHPDSDYSTFVGAYKPTMKKVPRIVQVGMDLKNPNYAADVDAALKVEEKISYEFRPQAFMNAYVAAWKEMTKGGAGKPIVLVIEEINRGNCAQIFGDLFQLLDRGDHGYSTYPIDADTDLAKWLKSDEKDENNQLLRFGSAGLGLARPTDLTFKMKQSDWDAVMTGKKLALPPNLYIWATMNTSDQSLFPIDSAFKRRWDWKYVPISKPDTADGFKDRKIIANGNAYDWWDFISIINEQIADVTKSEDKQLGYFFVKAPDATGHITAERFANKVLFYLFNDVFKDWDLPEKIFGTGSGKNKYAFKDFFYRETTVVGGKTFKPGTVKEEVVAEFIEKQKDAAGKTVGKASLNPPTPPSVASGAAPVA